MNKKANVQQGSVRPTLFITKNKQRVKQHGKTVYLNNGDEFELELFNPTQGKVLAKIKLNGKYIGSGLMLRPGERVFLERYLDESKKFEFSTYEVNGKSKEVKEAIRNNGKVEVEFYNEYTPLYWYSSPTFVYNNTGNQDWRKWINDDPHKYTITCDGNVSIGSNSPFSTLNIDTNSQTYTTTGDISFSYNSRSNVLNEKSNGIETGRVEKGSYSDQSLEYDDTQFNSWSTWTDEWTILPKSQKVLKREEIVVYCTSCGAKRKKSSHKFCPHCGNEF